MTDFIIRDHGSITILIPKTPEATAWVADNIDHDAQWWAGGVAVESRYVQPILDGILDDGLIF